GGADPGGRAGGPRRDGRSLRRSREDRRRPRSGYAPVNGLRMSHELHGEGPPLVLLHGAFSAIGTSFGEVLPGLAPTRHVIGLEQQAQGRTADIDRPLSLEQLAEDTAALLRYLQLEQADVFGYSVGAAVACASPSAARRGSPGSSPRRPGWTGRPRTCRPRPSGRSRRPRRSSSATRTSSPPSTRGSCSAC